ncbi:hypothetical protein LV84_01675 [Algoriphagus ratkowskyi]|uniref:WD40 repeat protein n=3 Tax=Algoriphagus ratkowskyi TaxID=57028 RepID=A0A2W7RHB2_9BACT|nr:hypothetical protein LV84_01675 [Algoriphagus ratkowskyi]
MPTSMELYVTNADGSEARKLTDLGKAHWVPLFHPSGEKIIFASNYQTERGYPFILFIIKLDGYDLTLSHMMGLLMLSQFTQMIENT